jgi:hypothetical protein
MSVPIVLMMLPRCLSLAWSFFGEGQGLSVQVGFILSKSHGDCFSYKKLEGDSQMVAEDKGVEIYPNSRCNSLKANELQTIFDLLVTSWLSGDNNSPSSLNYIGPSLK